MKRSISKEFVWSVLKDYRYWLILIVALTAFVYGKRLVGPDGVIGTEQENPFYGGQHLIGSSASEVTVPNLFDSRAGDYYRITFKGQNYSVKSLAKSPLIQGEIPSSNLVSVFAVSPEGATKELKKLVLPENQFAPVEVLFAADGEYRDLRFVRDSGNFADHVSINDIRVSRLAVHNDQQLASLKPAIVGATKTETITAESAQEAPGPIFDFNRKFQLAGQVFKANDAEITSIALRMQIKGSGGLGNYGLELHEATQEGDSWKIGQAVLASTSFDSVQAQTIYRLEAFSNGYRFPLIAKVTKGAYYFIGINNSVSFSAASHLQLYGTKDAGTAEGAAGVVDKKTGALRKFGTQSFTVYGADFVQYAGKEISEGTVIQDLGQGQGAFSYDGDASYLSGFDRTQDPGGKEAVYRFDTVYPMRNVGINFRLEGATPEASLVGIKAYYSLDGANWVELKLNNRIDKSDDYELANAQGEGKTAIFLKILKDTGDTVADIRVKNLIVRAALSLN